MHAIARGDWGLKVLALALAGVNLILWYAAPWLRNFYDSLTGRFVSPHRPIYMTGVQELLVYFDPWLARFVFPAVYTLGFVAIAFLFQPAPNHAGKGSGAKAVAILLLSFEAVWLFLIAFTILCRGPDWNFYWPWEEWILKVVPMNSVYFSAIWSYWSGLQIPETPWILRESPGLLLAAGYLSLGMLVARTLSRGAGLHAAYCCFVALILFLLAPLCLRAILAPRPGDPGLKLLLLLLLTSLILGVSYLLLRLLRAWGRSQVAEHPMAYWRCVLLVFLVQAAALVPVKVLLYWAFDLKYFIFVPEYSVNV